MLQKSMNFNHAVTRQYLLKSHTDYTIRLLSTHRLENIGHHTINHYLRTESLDSQYLWRNVCDPHEKEELVC